MEFIINSKKIKILEASQEEIKEKIKERAKREIEAEPDCGRYFGMTCHDENLILIDKELPEDTKRNTLIHELTHCYIFNYISHTENNYPEEAVCDIVANSHKIITDILNKYYSKER